MGQSIWGKYIETCTGITTCLTYSLFKLSWQFYHDITPAFTLKIFHCHRDDNNDNSKSGLEKREQGCYMPQSFACIKVAIQNGGGNQSTNQRLASELRIFLCVSD